jgi:hypothetical protein
MPRIPLRAPTLAWTRPDLPDFPPGSVEPPLVGHGKVVCYRFIQVRMPGDGAQELRGFDLGNGKPLFALSRLRDEETIPSCAAFEPEGGVVLMESVPDGTEPGSRGLLAVLDDRGAVRRQRPFAEARISPLYSEIRGLQVCGGVAVGTFVGSGDGAPRMVYGVPLDPGQAEWVAVDSELAGVAARVVVLVEHPSRAARVVARSPGGEVIWRGPALPPQATPGFHDVGVGARLIVVAVPGEGGHTSLLALDPESGKERFQREVQGRIQYGMVTDTGVVTQVKAGKVASLQVLDFDGELIGMGPSLEWFADAAVDGERLQILDLDAARQYRLSAYRVGTPEPLWSVTLPEADVPPVAFDRGFVVRTKRHELSVYRSPE